MKRTILILIVLLSSISFTQNPPTQAQNQALRFKVAVLVSCENESAKSLMESYIKRELRSLGDVQIVGNHLKNPLWEHLIDIHGLEMKYKSGAKTGSLAICTQFFSIVPHTHFHELWQEHYKEFPAVTVPLSTTSYHPVDRLDSFSKSAVAYFDTNKLQLLRDLRTRFNNN